MSLRDLPPYVIPGWDGHTHTALCPHGSREDTGDFILRAIDLGFSRYSLTEHFPFPPDFQDPTPMRDCALPLDDLERYLDHAHDLKQRFAASIDIRVGFEYDFLPGHESWLKERIDAYSDRLEDGILSVHFLEGRCLDFSPAMFRDEVVSLYGSVAATHRAYYRTLLKGVTTDWGPFGPKRLGHLNVIRKFVRSVPIEEGADFSPEISSLLDALQREGWSLDYNVAGLLKPDCREPYVPGEIVDRIARERRNIPLVYGSDTHSVKGVGQRYADYESLFVREAG